MPTSGVYLDHAATTPIDPRVLDAMQPYWNIQFGNASSLHRFGRDAKDAMQRARESLASLIGASADEIVFTSGGTEANNLALKGVAFANRARGNHIIVSAIEHDCVLNSCRWLAKQGFEISLVPVDSEGLVDVDDVAKRITDRTTLVSIMHANNEIGTVEPISQIGAVCRNRGVLFHTDACQSFGKIRIDVNVQNIDLMTINGHKMHGPKGVGALYVRRGTTIEATQHGGGHERGLRSSTENIPGIIGMVRAAEIAYDEFDVEIPRLRAIRDRLIDTISERVPCTYVNGSRWLRLPNHVNIAFAGYEGEGIHLLLALDDAGFAVSAGSACSANDPGHGPSHVLTAIGRDPLAARGAVRITPGRFTTDADIDGFIETIVPAIDKLHPLSL